MSAGTSELMSEIERLRAELARREEEAAHTERQLERYAADLSTTYKELRDSYTATVRALSNAVEARDVYTGKHAERVTEYGLAIARVVGRSATAIPDLEYGFLLHDVGKIAIPDAILLKPEPLTAEERALIKQHPAIGASIVRGFLPHAAELVRAHHERWDGSGYPDGLAGEQIPLAARIFTVADVLDALTTDRPYRPASPLAVAREMIVAQSGSQFDPRVVDAFESIDDDALLEIAAEIR